MTLSNLRAYLQIKRVAKLVVMLLTITLPLTAFQAFPAQANPTFTVTFDKNTASGVAPAAITVAQGSSITLPGSAGMTKGETFAGWSAVPVASKTSANGQAENRRTEIATW